MSTTVTYKGATLTTVDNATVTLNTAGKYCEDDFTLTDVSGGGGVGEITFEGTLAITNTTNLWQYVDDDPLTSAYIITLSDLYVNNHYMNFMSEWTLLSDVGQAIDMPLYIHVRDGNDDYDYNIYLQMNPASQETYIYGGSSLRANVKKIVKVAM